MYYVQAGNWRHKKIWSDIIYPCFATFSKSDVKNRSCVDYILNVLVYENIATIGNLVGKEILASSKQRIYLLKLDGITEYLNYNNISHISNDDDDQIHGMTYALLNRKDTEHKTVKFTECISMFSVLEHIRRDVINSSETLDAVMNDCINKARLYMGHVQRSLAQTKRICDIISGI